MTQLGLNLDRFEHVRQMVSTSVDAKAKAASEDFKELFKFQRYRLGQTVRWAKWRAAK